MTDRKRSLWVVEYKDPGRDWQASTVVEAVKADAVHREWTVKGEGTKTRVVRYVPAEQKGGKRD